MRQAIAPQHYKTISQWLERIALLIFAALVVQNLLKGAEFNQPIAIFGIASSFALYMFALYFLLKS